ncbi:MAG: GTP-binding protein [Cyanobacteria bacterium P01_D01_bin.44]
MLTVVAGPLGGGKTHWILAKLLNRQETTSSPSGVYISPMTSGVDAHRLLAHIPTLKIETDQPATIRTAENLPIYLELGNHLSLDLPWLAQVPHHRVAVLPTPTDRNQFDWSQWADEVVQLEIPPDTAPPLSPVMPLPEPANLWQANLSGQVLDSASLDTFWSELTQGAYGEVIRAKAIVDLADGQSFYFDFLQSRDTQSQALPLPKWLKGRPDRFSGIEVMGKSLDPPSLVSTLQACCLSDALLASHQATIRQNQFQEVA